MRAENRAIVTGRSWVRPVQNHCRTDGFGCEVAVSGRVRLLVPDRSRDGTGRPKERHNGSLHPGCSAARSRPFRLVAPASEPRAPRNGVLAVSAAVEGRIAPDRLYPDLSQSPDEKRPLASWICGCPWRVFRRSLAAAIAVTSAVLSSRRGPSRNSRRTPLPSRSSICSCVVSSCSAASLSVQNLETIVLFMRVPTIWIAVTRSPTVVEGPVWASSAVSRSR